MATLSQTFRKGLFRFRRSLIDGPGEDQIMSMTQGRRELSLLLPVIRQLARRPCQFPESSSRNYPQYGDESDAQEYDEEDGDDDYDEDEEDDYSGGLG